MKNRRMEISISKTVNLGDFENVKVYIGLEQDIQDKDSLNERLDIIFKDVEIKLSEYCEELEKLHSNKNKRLKVNKNG